MTEDQVFTAYAVATIVIAIIGTLWVLIADHVSRVKRERFELAGYQREIGRHMTLFKHFPEVVMVLENVEANARIPRGPAPLTAHQLLAQMSMHQRPQGGVASPLVPGYLMGDKGISDAAR